MQAWMGTRCSAALCAAALKRRVLKWAAVLSAEAQLILDPPLRTAALGCNAGFEWPALQRGAAAAKKEARSLPFFLPKFEKKKLRFSCIFN
jgi:hypothetical protein